MTKEIVLRFDAINKRRQGIGYFGPTKETLQSLPRSGLVLHLSIVIRHNGSRVPIMFFLRLLDILLSFLYI
jgi:hypothetical protein